MRFGDDPRPRWSVRTRGPRRRTAMLAAAHDFEWVVREQHWRRAGRVPYGIAVEDWSLPRRDPRDSAASPGYVWPMRNEACDLVVVCRRSAQALPEWLQHRCTPVEGRRRHWHRLFQPLLSTGDGFGYPPGLAQSEVISGLLKYGVFVCDNRTFSVRLQRRPTIGSCERLTDPGCVRLVCPPLVPPAVVDGRAEPSRVCHAMAG